MSSSISSSDTTRPPGRNGRRSQHALRAAAFLALVAGRAGAVGRGVGSHDAGSGRQLPENRADDGPARRAQRRCLPRRLHDAGVRQPRHHRRATGHPQLQPRHRRPISRRVGGRPARVPDTQRQAAPRRARALREPPEPRHARDADQPIRVPQAEPRRT